MVAVPKTIKKARTLGGALTKQERSNTEASLKPASEKPSLQQAASFHGDFNKSEQIRASSNPPAPRGASPSRSGSGGSALKEGASPKSARRPAGGSTVTFSENSPSSPAAKSRGRLPLGQRPVGQRPTTTSIKTITSAKTSPGGSPPSKPSVASPSEELKAQTSPADLMQSDPIDITPTTAATPSPSPLKSRTRTMDTTPPKEEIVEIGQGRKTKKTGSAPAPALNTKNEWFGTGERMEAQKFKKWSQLVDKHNLGAHYDFVVSDLTAHLAVEDSDQKQHDEAIADGLTKRRPSDPQAQRPLASIVLKDMRTGFTDRALRMREGHGAKSAMMPPEPATTEWGCHGECSCAVCKPHDKKPAGQPSHHVHYNKVPRCNKDSHPKQPHWENELAHTFNSNKMSAAFVHRDEQRESEQPPAEEEKAFHQNMGRKIKSPTPQSPGGSRMYLHRSFSDNLSVSAGQFNQDKPSEIGLHSSKGRQAWQGTRQQSPTRSGVAYILDPSEMDPPPPSRILAARKADGHFKAGHTAHAEQISAHYNQETFRFADSNFVRGRSVSPPKLDSSAGVRTNQWCRSTSPPASPNARNRVRMGNSSRTMAAVMSHDAGEEDFARESAHRAQHDATFRELCRQTADHYETQKSLADDFKKSFGHAKCSVSKQMEWNEQ